MKKYLITLDPFLEKKLEELKDNNYLTYTGIFRMALRRYISDSELVKLYKTDQKIKNEEIE